MTYHLISVETALERVNERINEQYAKISRFRKGKYGRRGIAQRIIALQQTATALRVGLPCSRQVAQLFSAGYRTTCFLIGSESVTIEAKSRVDAISKIIDNYDESRTFRKELDK